MAHHWLKMANYRHGNSPIPRAMKFPFRKYIYLFCKFRTSRDIRKTVLSYYIYTYIGLTFLNNLIFECPWTENYTTYRLQILHTYSLWWKDEVCVIS